MSQIEALSPPEPSPMPRSESTTSPIYEKCYALAGNLWWTWHPEVVNLFRDLDPIRWRQLDHNPIELLREFTPDAPVVRA